MDNRRLFERAVAEGCKVKMIYQKGDEVIERIITPRRVTSDIISCYDHFRRQQRNYKLDNVLAISLLLQEDA